MISYDYLESMFGRLAEAKKIMASVGKDAKARMLAENHVLAVKYSIKDYIKAHAEGGHARD